MLRDTPDAFGPLVEQLVWANARMHFSSTPSSTFNEYIEDLREQMDGVELTDKQKILEHLNARLDPRTGERILVYMSDQLVTLDEAPRREWQASELRTTVAGDRADVEAFESSSPNLSMRYKATSACCALRPSAFFWT